MSDTTKHTTTLDDAAAEIAQLKERLEFYERFDQLIQQQVAQSSELLREASRSRQSASDLAAQELERLNAERDLDLDNYRTLFSKLLDEITQLQTQAEHLAVMVSDAVDEIELRVPASRTLPGIPDFDHDAFPDAEIVPAVETAPVESHGALADRSQSANVEIETQQSGSLAHQDSSDRTFDVHEGPDTVRPSGEIMVLVHGLPDTEAAIALKRFVESIDSVSKVVPKEMTAGLLRLNVESDRVLSQRDFEGWDSTRTLETIVSGQNVLEMAIEKAS